jgi:hypothetical protein
MGNKIIIPVTDKLVMPIIEQGDTRTEVEIMLPNAGQVSDGYHTFDELYHYRMLYNAAFANEYHKEYDRVVKSWRHSDGELCFGKDNYFVVVMQLPTGQVSNHYHGEHWDLFQVDEVERAPEWDGHTPQQAAERLEKYLGQGA